MTKPNLFDLNLDRALRNRFLQLALKRATGAFKDLRSGIINDLENFEELRQRAKEAKDRVLGRLDHYLTRLEASVTQAGGRVFWASTGDEVARYILTLARAKGLKSVVKGKSMTTEEIGLNPVLEQAGLEVLETDLGEYIIQLVGERPSHLIVPAVHKTREETARLFQKKLGLAYTDRPEELTRAVRDRLRGRFLSADLGVTGVNFAVAETGTLVLLENEGNIRMSSTLPRIHVAVMGLEKVVADFRDLAVLLQILPISATGQRLPSYVSFITGPGRHPGEGPEELHLILYDGYRTKVLADPDFRQVLRCLRCGACLNFCPVYRRIGGHTYPWTYSGPIGVVLTAAARGLEEARDIVGASTLCRACGQVCPVMIDLPELILEARRRLAEQTPAGPARAFDLAAHCLATPAGFDLAARGLSAAAGAMIDRQGLVRRGPEKIWGLGEGRRLPRPAEEPFRRSLFKGDEK